jgi:hypothetical protein
MCALTERISMRMFVLFALTVVVTAACPAANYTGSLSYSNDTSYGFTALAINASTGWRKSSVLTWTVSNERSGAPNGFGWFYSYDIVADSFAPVAWVIETGEGFSAEHINLASVKVYDDGQLVTYNTSNISFGWFADADPIRRSMPDERYGMYWTATSPGGNNTKSTTITFWSSVAPVWGDMYSNCGGNGNRGWNSGFLTDNPQDAVSSGSVQNHVLTPGVIPEPATALLLALGGGITWLARMKQRW